MTDTDRHYNIKQAAKTLNPYISEEKVKGYRIGQTIITVAEERVLSITEKEDGTHVIIVAPTSKVVVPNEHEGKFQDVIRSLWLAEDGQGHLPVEGELTMTPDAAIEQVTWDGNTDEPVEASSHGSVEFSG